jgi:hypothetical protein
MPVIRISGGGYERLKKGNVKMFWLIPAAMLSAAVFLEDKMKKVAQTRKVATVTGALLILLGSLAFFGCDPPLPEVIDFDRDTFNREWEVWEKQGIVNYTVWESISDTFSAGSESGYITVLDNVVIGKEPPLWQVPPDGEPMFDSWLASMRTISEIYASVNKTYENALERIEADKGKSDGIRGMEIKATYNKEFHYPEYVEYGYLHFGGDVDGAGSIIIRLLEFTPLAPAE